MHATPAVTAASHLLASFALILAVGVLTGAAARRLRVPDVVVFLLTGIALGPHGLGWVGIAVDSTPYQLVLIFGSSLILFDGGAMLHLGVLRRVWISVLLLATVGVLITTAVVGLAAHALLGLALLPALLLGSVVASTDPASLVPVLRQVKIRPKVAQTLLAESAFNDAIGAILTFALLGLLLGGSALHAGAVALDLLRQAGFGLAVGAGLGALALLLTAHRRFGFLQQHAPVVTLIAVAGAYLGAAGLRASGFIAVFAAGIVLGNPQLLGLTRSSADAARLDDFIATTALILRVFIFVLLGSQVDLGLLRAWWPQALGLSAVLMLVARPLVVLLCAGADRRARWSWQELVLLGWSRETGVIPGALAGMLLGLGLPQAGLIASATFMAIVLTIGLQASTTAWLATRLGLLETER